MQKMFKAYLQTIVVILDVKSEAANVLTVSLIFRIIFDGCPKKKTLVFNLGVYGSGFFFT